MSNMIEFKCGIFIEASPETVFSYLTEQEKAAQWFGEIVDIQGVAGGKFFVASKDGNECSGDYLEVTPYEKVVFTWGNVAGLEHGESTVEILLKAENGGTQLSLRHYNIPTQEAADSFGHGWPNFALPLLKLVSEGGITDQRCYRSGHQCGNEAAA